MSTFRPSRPSKEDKYEYFKKKHTTLFGYYLNPWITGGVLASLYGIYYVIHLEKVPLSERVRFMNVSKKKEAEMSAIQFKQLMAEFGNRILPENHEITQMVRRVAQRIIKASKWDFNDHWNWQVYVVNAPLKNAFVIPGGKIFVFTGILPIAKNEDGIAAILGHEIAHQMARHNAEKLSLLNIFIWTRLVLQFIGMGSTPFDSLAFYYLNAPFSRSCESEADYIGLLLMSRACFDPYEAAKIWDRFSLHSHDSAMPEYLSTHPSHTTRKKKITEWMPEALKAQQESECIQTRSFYDSFWGTPMGNRFA